MNTTEILFFTSLYLVIGTGIGLGKESDRRSDKHFDLQSDKEKKMQAEAPYRGLAAVRVISDIIAWLPKLIIPALTIIPDMIKAVKVLWKYRKEGKKK